MGIHIRVNSKMVNFMDKVNIHLKVDVPPKVNFGMVIVMVHMKEDLEKEKSVFGTFIF